MRIKEETQKDEVREKHKRKRPETYPHVKQELSVAEGLIFKEHRIILPPATCNQILGANAPSICPKH